ncbi:hypothetical protein C8Q75DRAFT_218882 [Abortiporus biennis]|nr:hypothetical protein C8Q75DRAFT_218882 [Abortiporus biennis]
MSSLSGLEQYTTCDHEDNDTIEWTSSSKDEVEHCTILCRDLCCIRRGCELIAGSMKTGSTRQFSKIVLTFILRDLPVMDTAIKDICKLLKLFSGAPRRKTHTKPHVDVYLPTRLGLDIPPAPILQDLLSCIPQLHQINVLHSTRTQVSNFNGLRWQTSCINRIQSDKVVIMKIQPESFSNAVISVHKDPANLEELRNFMMRHGLVIEYHE